MRCANCDHPKLSVDRTYADTAETITRCRICSNCGYKVFTVEVELPPGTACHQHGREKLKRLPGALRIHFS